MNADDRNVSPPLVIQRGECERGPTVLGAKGQGGYSVRPASRWPDSADAMGDLFFG